ncbi:MAG: GNAT family N-acetyltransferase [Desulfobulbaceae bacterium]|nr:GNAT family N-acetyltransferase [Desulfobulbaceae bacterium]
MSIRNLKYLFTPESIAVIGASNRPHRVGTVITRNLLKGGFSGPIMPVNPKYKAVSGVLAYPDINDLPIAPDLAIICTPPLSVPDLIDNLGKRGTRAVVVVTAGLGRALKKGEKTVQEAMLEAARRRGVRVLGPNCLGLLVPESGLNASFSHVSALPGAIGFISQSGALATTVLDWASSKGIGFSHFISLGDAADVDFDDILDYLAADPSTKAILMYIESIHHRRNFMSAARAAARSKPVIVIKAGRVAEGARAAASHTGAMAGSDMVFDAAISRAGMLRVYNFNELFAAVETLARYPVPIKADRLLVITNGGGPGVMAVDSLIASGGHLAELSRETIAELDKVLTPNWSRANPVDIIGDAPGARYTDALKILFNAPEADALLVMHAPTAITSSLEVAQAVIELYNNLKDHHKKFMLTNWLGEEAVREARFLFSGAGIPSYRTPEGAVRAFMHLVRYRQNNDILMQTPPSTPTEFTPDIPAARKVIENAIGNGNSVLSEPEAKKVLSAYGIPTVETYVVETAREAGMAAVRAGFPVALKIHSHDISHKSDVRGVVLDLETEEDVVAAAESMLPRINRLLPQAKVHGFTVQRMAYRTFAHELIIGMATDPVFGPVILFGQGGTAVEVIGDRAIALPPLNMNLARELISRTRVFKLLKGYRDQPPANLDAICLTLMQVAQLTIDIPEIMEIDINPLFAGPDEVLAVDARISVEPATGSGAKRLAIRPYPQELEENVMLKSGRKVLLRPIRPEDEANHYIFLSKLTHEDSYSRFFRIIGKMSHNEMARLTQIDYDREMAFIATALNGQGDPETLGVVRTFFHLDNTVADFMIVVRSDQQRQGLGRKLMEKMILYCRKRGILEIVGDILIKNKRMFELTESLGFKQHSCLNGHAVRVCLRLR